MKNIIIGTAGHIDHGKTELVKALTGIDTDRLKEEKRRGMSIDLGFAHLDLPDGTKVGIVDVPGHEKFIKNMLAGATGIDLVLLVVDATEGVRAQTREHLDIINLLGVSKGIVAITKIDLASPDQIESCQAQLREVLRGTALEEAPMVQVSSVTKAGIKELKSKLEQQVTEAAKTVPDRTEHIPRLPIDRTFIMPGFGLVVTGTLMTGTISKEDQVNILPQGLRARVRGIQVHGEPKEKAFAGQRTALNLAGVSREDLKYRGDVITSTEIDQLTQRIDTKFHFLSSNRKPLKDGVGVHLYLGTADIIARAHLLEKDILIPGETGYVQFKLETPALAFRKDRFIIRDFAAQRTLGGGEIVNPFPTIHKGKEADSVKELSLWEKAAEPEIVRLVANAASSPFVTENRLKYWLPYSEAKLEPILQLAKDEGWIYRLTIGEDKGIISTERLSAIEEDVLDQLRQFHIEQPLELGKNYARTRAELKMPARHTATAGGEVDARLFERIIDKMVQEGKIVKEEQVLRLPQHRIVFSESELALKEEIETVYLRAGFSPPDRKELWRFLPGWSAQDIDKVFEALVKLGILVRVGSDIFFHKEVIDRGIAQLTEFIQKHNQITVAEFRDLVGTTRKYAVPFLEYCDRLKITIRQGDLRLLRR